MPYNSFPGNESDSELDPISSILSEWSDPEIEEEEFRSDFFQGLEGRRKKAAFTLMMIWAITIALNQFAWGTWVILVLTGILSIQAIRIVIAKPQSPPKALSDEQLLDAPSVSILVAAKNEETVIANLIKRLFEVDYPRDKYEVWIIDDHSTDKTPEILDQLALEYKQLKIIHRASGASGGKSGALNQVLPLTTSEIIGVFDADAQLTPDLLLSVVSLFQKEKIGAVQVRKAINNASVNFWTRGQTVEMALDSYFQQQRIAIGGIGELRGNGQFVRRQALESSGGWNEQTITDDLDLTIRLHLDRWDIGFLQLPPVQEEGVTNIIALWHQRNRWGEGGYQRYLDYWRWIISNRLGVTKKIDLLSFVLMQYVLPTAAIADLLMMVIRHKLPVLAPLTTMMLFLSFWGMFIGLLRSNSEKLTINRLLINFWHTCIGAIYMLHWLIVMPSVITRMAIRPKRLKWVKTVHEGTIEENFEVEQIS